MLVALTVTYLMFTFVTGVPVSPWDIVKSGLIMQLIAFAGVAFEVVRWWFE